MFIYALKPTPNQCWSARQEIATESQASWLNVLTSPCCSTLGSAPCMSKVPHPVTSQLVPIRGKSVEGRHTEPMQSSNGIGESSSSMPKSKLKWDSTLKDGWIKTRRTPRDIDFSFIVESWCHPPATTLNLPILQSLRKAVQCAAVRTHLSETSVPPQKCCRVPFISARRLTCHFHVHSLESSPCTIRFWRSLCQPSRPRNFWQGHTPS